MIMDIEKEFEELKKLIEHTYYLVDKATLKLALDKLEKIRKEIGA